MSNLENYNKVFLDTFKTAEEKLSTLEYNTSVEWDSVGHMELIATLEETFNIELEMDDIINFSSYQKGKEILVKYGVTFE
jgi:acyl carrier protein